MGYHQLSPVTPQLLQPHPYCLRWTFELPSHLSHTGCKLLPQSSTEIGRHGQVALNCGPMNITRPLPPPPGTQCARVCQYVCVCVCVCGSGLWLSLCPAPNSSNHQSPITNHLTTRFSSRWGSYCGLVRAMCLCI